MGFAPALARHPGLRHFLGSGPDPTCGFLDGVGDAADIIVMGRLRRPVTRRRCINSACRPRPQEVTAVRTTAYS
ncbi:MAG: hypothetical protein RMK84_04590 [Oscillochloridaceae bacterium]|nr:hypothetical protein [Chloroflexaceae bacterium]MDW8389381.1 hypothetical protein [Oscillochloridaceae bacterium]